jgi:putative transposase
MKKFQNKYRIESARLSSWDYSRPGSYFITICTKKRNHFFGEIINEIMHLNEIGLIADSGWRMIPGHYENMMLDEFVVMPNHIHGIIIINDISVVVEAGHAPSLPQPPKNTVSNMVGSFKSAVTKLARPINPDFGWQSRFHDHIIRNQAEFIRISNYIINNPANWDSDKFR